jgi:tetratricopeptide (TPR) repeat protein
VLHRHYEQAQAAQTAKNLPEAARQYRVFLADALGEMALQHAHLGEYNRAAPLFDEALALAPRSPGLQVSYAQAALDAKEYSRARTLAEEVIRDYPANTRAVARSEWILGRVLADQSDDAAARPHFEAAVALEPNFDNGYALAIDCLNLGDGKCAATVFSEMLTGLGDTAVLHFEIGRAYLNSDFQPLAVPEFEKAIAEDGHLAGAHYMLASAYLLSGSDHSLARAEDELRLELQLSPNDARTHAQLGNIALQQKQFEVAEKELRLSIALDAVNPDAFLYLGQLCQQTGRLGEAISALRQSISLTEDPSYHRYQVQNAHYLLGRLLIQRGQTDAGEQELAIASTLLHQRLKGDRTRLSKYMAETPMPGDGAQKSGAGLATTSMPAAQSAQLASALKDFAQRLAPAIADSYNNLGVISASAGQYEPALTYFERAAEWNPALDGLDANWGKAAYLAKHFSEAQAPLKRYLQSHPSDADVRDQLAVSCFMSMDYTGALATLDREPSQAKQTGFVGYVYAASLLHTGQAQEGMDRLLLLEKSDPSIAEVHATLGEEYLRRKKYEDASRELNTAIQLNPLDAAAYRSLGMVQWEQDETQEAVTSLEHAASLDPGKAEIHRELSAAYRKAERQQDAQREWGIYETMKGREPNESITSKN